MCSLVSLEMLDSELILFTALDVESWPGVLQLIQKHIQGWKVGLKDEISGERRIQSTDECKILGGVSYGEFF